jgi:hypothetical protein
MNYMDVSDLKNPSTNLHPASGSILSQGNILEVITADLDPFLLITDELLNFETNTCLLNFQAENLPLRCCEFEVIEAVFYPDGGSAESVDEV